MKRGSTILIVLLSVIVILITLGFGAYYFLKQPPSSSKSEKAENLEKSRLEQVTSKNTNGSQEVQLYSNEEFGYSILHPTNWQKSEDSSPPEGLAHALFFYPDFSSNKVITIGVTQKVYTMEDTREETNKTIQKENGELIEFKEITHNNLTAYTSVISYKNRDLKVKSLTLPLSSKGISFVVGCIGDTSFYEATCDKVINSFTISL